MRTPLRNQLLRPCWKLEDSEDKQFDLLLDTEVRRMRKVNLLHDF
jgi:hypothetical protein